MSGDRRSGVRGPGPAAVCEVKRDGGGGATELLRGHARVPTIICSRKATVQPEAVTVIVAEAEVLLPSCLADTPTMCA